VANAESKAVYKVTSSDAGVYAFAQLLAGTYQLSSTTPGFYPFVLRGLTVSTGRTLQTNLHFLDIQLNTLGDGPNTGAALDRLRSTPAGPTPGMPDGKPDLSGMWSSQRTVDPGKPEIKAWAEAVAQERMENNAKDFPQARCQPLGIVLAPTLQCKLRPYW
jgi:Carboxypeptidase regulatory-like domain